MPLQGFDPNRIWCLVVALACDNLAWAQMLALHGRPARRWEPTTVRHRLLTVAAVIVRHARRTAIRYKACQPFAGLLTHAISNLRALPAP